MCDKPTAVTMKIHLTVNNHLHFPLLDMDKEGHFDIRTPVLNHIIHGNIQNQSHSHLFLCLQIHVIYYIVTVN